MPGLPGHRCRCGWVASEYEWTVLLLQQRDYEYRELRDRVRGGLAV